MLNRTTFLKYFSLIGLMILGLGSSLNPAAAKLPAQSGLRYPVANVRNFGAQGNGTTNDTAAIQRAIDSLAQSGGTVFFPSGTYLISQAITQTQTFPWCLMLRSNIDYVGVGPGSKLLLAPGQEKFTRMMSTIITQTSRNITIRRLHFDGNRANQDDSFEHQHAVLLAAVEDCLVTECLFHDTQGDAVFVHAGTLSVSSRRVLVADNEMHSLNRVGVNFQGASNSIARSNFIHDTTNNAMKVEQDSPVEPAASGNQFIRNLVRNAGGISLSNPGNRSNVSNMLIQDNTFDTILGPAVGVSEATNIKVIGNAIIRAGGYGVLVRSAQDVTISNNRITQTVFGEVFNAAILVFSDTLPPSVRTIIESNEIRENAMTAFRLQQSVDGVIRNNLIVNNLDQAGLYGQGTGIDLLGSSTGTLVKGNIVRGNNFAVLIREGANNNSFQKNKFLANIFGGIWLQSDAGSGNDFDASWEGRTNCIQGNTPFGLRNDTASTVEARGNFWGCAAGPGNPGCDAVIGPVLLNSVSSRCP